MPLDNRFGLDDGQGGSPVGPESGEPDPEDPVAGPQLGTFDGVLVDGNLLPQGEVLGGQAEPGHQECSDQKVDRFDDAHEEVSQSRRETGILLPRRLRIKPRNSLTGNAYGIIDRHRYNKHRPHTWLNGRTPDGVLLRQFPANRKPRFEPCACWPRRSPCARPWALVRGSPGARLTVEVSFHKGKRHLPIVTIKRAA